MKIFNSSIFRAIVAIISGALLFQFKDNMMDTMTRAIGALFFLSGVISIIVYYVNHKKSKQQGRKERTLAGEALPVVGLGSCILGGILFFSPDVFQKWLLIIFSAIVILGAIGEFIALIQDDISIRRNYPFWICPVILLSFGVLAIASPKLFGSDEKLLVWLAVAYILYGLSEIAITIKARSIAKAAAREDIKTVVRTDSEISDALVISERKDD